MILIGIGSNLPSVYGPPRETCAAAVEALEGRALEITMRSRWYRSAPVPMSDQPWFVNGVVAVLGPEDPVALLHTLHAVEARFGRPEPEQRAGEPKAARVLDLDLLAFNDLVRQGPKPPILPHPRMTERAFVLLPLREIAPEWRHPVSGVPIADLIDRLAEQGIVQPLD